MSRSDVVDLLLRLSIRLGRSEGPASVLDVLLDTVLAQLDADGAAIEIRCDPAETPLVRSRTRAAADPRASDPVSLALRLARHASAPLISLSLDRPEPALPELAALKELGIRHVLAAELRALSGRRLGDVVVFWRGHAPAPDAETGFGHFVGRAAEVLQGVLATTACSCPAGDVSDAHPAVAEVMRRLERGLRDVSSVDGLALVLPDGEQYRHDGSDRGLEVPRDGRLFGQLAALARLARADGRVAVVEDLDLDPRIGPGAAGGPAASALVAPLGTSPPAVIIAWASRSGALDPRAAPWAEGFVAAAAAMLAEVPRREALEAKVRAREDELVRLRTCHERLQDALLAGAVFAWEWRPADDRLWVSGGCAGILGVPEGRVPRTRREWEEQIHPEDRVAHAGLRDPAHADGRVVTAYRFTRPDGSTIWLQEEGCAQRAAGGEIIRVTGLTRDITARRRIEELQRLLMREFDHRARNMLATIQAVISLTARTQTDMDRFVAAVQSRIRSMARAHELIAGSRWVGAGVFDIIRDELEPYVAGRPEAASLVGQNEMLTPGATMAVAMAVHELTTNAAKYGALSVAEGRVAIAVARDRQGELLIEWQESGGPPVVPPRHRGFGSLLIEGSIRTEVGGSAEIRYLPAGLACTLRIPPDHVVEVGSGGPPAVRRPAGDAAAVLVLEDPSIAIHGAAAQLRALGYRVVEAGGVEQALRLIAFERLVGAVVDINVGERDVLPVVEAMAARNLPAAFMTAHHLMRMPPAYRRFPVLVRPLRRETLERIFGTG